MKDYFRCLSSDQRGNARHPRDWWSHRASDEKIRITVTTAKKKRCDFLKHSLVLRRGSTPTKSKLSAWSFLVEEILSAITGSFWYIYSHKCVQCFSMSWGFFENRSTALSTETCSWLRSLAKRTKTDLRESKNWVILNTFRVAIMPVNSYIISTSERSVFASMSMRTVWIIRISFCKSISTSLNCDER